MAATLSTALRLVFAWLLIIASAQSSVAQTVVDSFAQLGEVVRPGTMIIIEDDTGERTKGKLQELSESGLTITSGTFARVRSLPAERVARVARVDSRLNGFLIGFGAGAVPGVILGSMINQYCYNESPEHCPGAILFLGGLFGGIGGLIGWGIDGLVDGETLVFARRATSSTTRLRIIPVVSRRGGGLTVAVRFGQ
jgi:hypothetical protein